VLISTKSETRRFVTAQRGPSDEKGGDQAPGGGEKKRKPSRPMEDRPEIADYVGLGKRK